MYAGRRRWTRTSIPLRVVRFVKRTSLLRARLRLLGFLLALLGMIVYIHPIVSLLGKTIAAIFGILVCIYGASPAYFFWRRRFGASPDGSVYWRLPKGGTTTKDLLRLADWLSAPIDYDGPSDQDGPDVRYVIRPVRARAESFSHAGQPEPNPQPSVVLV